MQRDGQARSDTRRSTGPRNSLPDGVQRVVGAEEQSAAGDRGGSQLTCVERVSGEDRRCLPGTEDDRFAILAHQIDLAVTGHGRSGVHAADSFLVSSFAGLGIGNREDADVTGHVEEAVVIDD